MAYQILPVFICQGTGPVLIYPGEETCCHKKYRISSVPELRDKGMSHSTTSWFRLTVENAKTTRWPVVE